jgi:uncharacterized membrane protein
MPGDRSRLRRSSPYLLAGLLTVTGSLHFLAPRPFVSIVPRRLKARRELVMASGAAELACAAGLVLPGTRRFAGWTTAALFVAVFPANVKMAVDSQRRQRSSAYRAAAWARLPGQVPLVLWARSVALDSAARSSSRLSR